MSPDQLPGVSLEKRAGWHITVRWLSSVVGQFAVYLLFWEDTGNVYIGGTKDEC